MIKRKKNLLIEQEPPQIATHHDVPSDDGENTNGTDEGMDLLFANKKRTALMITERIPQRNQKNRKYIHPQGEHKGTKKSSYCMIDCKKAYDIILQS